MNELIDVLRGALGDTDVQALVHAATAGGFLVAAHTTDTRDKPKRYATKPNLKAAHRRSRRAPNGHRTPAAATSGYAEGVGYSDRKKARWGKLTNSRQ